jgi:hypothetical protein
VSDLFFGFAFAQRTKSSLLGARCFSDMRVAVTMCASAAALAALPSYAAADDVDPAAIARATRLGLPGIVACYESELRHGNSAPTTIRAIRLTILPDGHVGAVDVHVRRDEARLRTCVTNTLRRMIFPPFRGAPITVDVPLSSDRTR